MTGASAWERKVGAGGTARKSRANGSRVDNGDGNCSTGNDAKDQILADSLGLLRRKIKRAPHDQPDKVSSEFANRKGYSLNDYCSQFLWHQRTFLSRHVTFQFPARLVGNLPKMQCMFAF